MKSMTAYARVAFESVLGNGAFELRSVNQRYLETFIRLPDSLRALEPLIREKLRQKLSRGKVECQLRFDFATSNSGAIEINKNAAKLVLRTLESLKTYSPNGVINLTEVLNFPNVLKNQEVDQSALFESALSAFDDALDAFIKTREREGEALKTILSQRVETMQQQVAFIKTHIGLILTQQKEKLIARFNELKLELDQQRIEQEIVLLLQRLDIAEELDRLNTHLNEVIRVLNQTQSAQGRRLDFLMQELNRETNTIASKSVNTDITNATIEMKVLIEQMREQIQNVE